ncbi:tyrosine-type recombinase/integrase [Desulfosporosinus sp. FKB]|uniref:tyrosine-type recombinase/integrase n=1 Tax=Desulfosporosinus sp. FKB TaxID=1969835 RepID=UPI000B49DD53|nr:tyrosine-type recombinase/integrase [Desulfosporosinus sp. FKB]
MVRQRLTVKDNNGFKPSVIRDRREQTVLSTQDFLELHGKFIQHKALEGLAPRTLKDHLTHMGYFKKFLFEDQRFSLDRYIDVDVFRGYLSHMISDKSLKPCTINIRLRTLKCFLKWLFDEDYIDFNYSLKLKLVKTPEDTIKPLSDSDTRKMLKAPDRSTYSGLRDFCLMVLMLDCGIRIGEAVKLTVNDVDTRLGLINVRPENAKTRVYRQLPISQKTCKLLIELIKIAQDNDSEYVFQSTFGGMVSKDNIIAYFEKYGKKAGVKVRCTPHIFRHTFATNFVRSGGDIFTLQKILGHSTLVMCRKYIQLDNSDLVRKHHQANPLDKYIQ